MNKTIQSVIQFWFGDFDCHPSNLPEAKFIARWWMKDDEFDDAIRVKFGDLIEQASRSELDDWKNSAKGTLALIILLDQFRRNIYRGTNKMYSSDAKALELTLHCINSGQIDELHRIEKVFIYMPLEHSEDLNMQILCVRKFKELLDDDTLPEEDKEMFNNFVLYAEQHHGIVKRFNRFPHRNETLYRDSTDDERYFLENEPNSSF